MNDLIKELKLGDLLRYGFAGAVFLFFVLALYEKPRDYLLDVLIRVPLDVFAATVLLGASLTIGSVIYALHRAIPYPFLYWLFTTRLAERGSILDLDIQRWRNSSKPLALQPKLKEWGDQIHFLYCVAWAGFSALLVGPVMHWHFPSIWYGAPVVAILSLLAFLAGMFHHCRYQEWERRVFGEDDY
jgi:hypothetical protein